jgi:tetratricopeptide (TPR) repeat protein
MSSRSKARGGRIITFYSYKGGTGRSMALSNLAWVLAANRRRVLMIDWDLEAPGLHRYFHPFLADKELASSRGLIDLLADYADQAIAAPEEGEGEDWYHPLTDLAPYLLGINFAGFPEGGRIDLLPAGRQGTGYALKLHSFDWDTFYDRLGGGTYLEAVKENLRATYDYVLIDSRTGVSDTAGICTVQMPDVLVAMFTYNNQSIRGALAVAESAADTRRRLYGQFSRETFRVFPIPSRADPFEVRKLQLRQAYARRLFTPLLDHLPEGEHSRYWSSVEVPYNAFLNYEEVLSPLIFNPEDPKLPLASVLSLANHVTDGEVTRYDLSLAPDEKQRLLQAYEQVDDLAETASAETATVRASSMSESPADALLRSADGVLAQLGPEQLELASRLILRLVRLPRGQESPGLKRLLVAVDDLKPEEQPLLDRFIQAGVVRLVRDKAGAAAIEIAEESLLTRWHQLNAWAEAEKTFLEQRYWLQSSWEQWQRAGRPNSLLLAGPLAEQATQLLTTHAPLLTADEIDFINTSQSFQSATSAPSATAAPPPSPPPAAATPPSRRAGLPVWTYATAGTVTLVLLVLAALPLISNLADSPPLAVNPLPVSEFASITKPEILTGTPYYPKPELWANLGDPRTDQMIAQAVVVNSSLATAEGFIIAGDQSLAAGRLDEAIDNFGTALKIRPDLPDALFKRARAYQLKKDTDKAIADLQAGLKLQPDQGEAQLTLANLLAEKNNTQAAVQHYQASLALNLSTQQRTAASQALQRLSPTSTPQVYLHINNRGDAAFAESLSGKLKGIGTQPMGIQVLAQANNADVRYANLADEGMARKVREVVQAALDGAGYKRNVELLYIGSSFPNTARGRIEVWLPPLATQQQSPAGKDPKHSE